MSSPFRELRILVAGGLGFIGSNLARRLVALDDGNLFNIKGIEKDVTVNVADVRDEYSMRQLVRDKDVLFNLAGQTSHVDSMTDPYTDLEINCRAQLSLPGAHRSRGRQGHRGGDCRVRLARVRPAEDPGSGP